MKRSTLVLLLIGSFLVASSPVRPAHADDATTQAEARAHFSRGVEFYKESDFRTALIEFKRAYEVLPNYKVLYNLGQTSFLLQDYASALRSFERYLADGGKEVPAARRVQVESDVEKLRKRVARIDVVSNVQDAEVFVDDVSVGRTPLPGPLSVSAGRRKISALKSGVTVVRMIDVVGGDTATVPLEILEPAPAPVVQAPAPPPARAPEPAHATPPAPPAAPARPAPEPARVGPMVWVGLAATGVLAAGAVSTGVLALNAKQEFDSAVTRFGVDAQAIEDARTRTRTLALATDILGGAALVAGGITLIGVIGASSSGGDTGKSVRLGVVPGGLSASGHF